MKIVYVDMQYSYGEKERGINYIGQDGFLRTFLKLGHSVEAFYYDDYLDKIKILQNDLIVFVNKIKPDLIFFSLYTDQFQFETLDYLKSKYKTIAWFGDDTWRFDDYSSKYALHFTYCITTDKFSIDKYKAIGQHNIIESQWAAINEHIISKCVGNYDYDVSFVGMKNDYREWFIDELRKRDIKIETYGHKWENGTVSNERMNEIFIKSKINLNIPNSFSFDSRFIIETKFKKLLEKSISRKKLLKSLIHKRNSLGDLLNINSLNDFFNIKPSDKFRGQIKARNFEIPYFGGFQITDYFPGIEDYFILGEEIICFKDIDEAEFLIKYYLKNENAREKIKNKSHIRSINNHGYIHRFTKIFDQISAQ